MLSINQTKLIMISIDLEYCTQVVFFLNYYDTFIVLFVILQLNSPSSHSFSLYLRVF